MIITDLIGHVLMFVSVGMLIGAYVLQFREYNQEQALAKVKEKKSKRGKKCQ